MEASDKPLLVTTGDLPTGMTLSDNATVRTKIDYLLEMLQNVLPPENTASGKGEAASISSSNIDNMDILASLDKFNGWLTSTVTEEDSMEHLVILKGGLLRGGLELISRESGTIQEAELLWAFERVPGSEPVHSNDLSFVDRATGSATNGKEERLLVHDAEALIVPSLPNPITTLAAFLRLVVDAIVTDKPISYFYTLAAVLLQFDTRSDGRSFLWLINDHEFTLKTAQKTFILGHMLASVASPLPVLKDLIRLRPDMASCMDCYGYLPLHHFASETWDAETLKYVIELNPAAVAVPVSDELQHTPIHTLIGRVDSSSESRKRLADLLKLLLDCGEYSKSALTTSTPASIEGSPLHLCCTSRVCKELFRLVFDAAPEVVNIVSSARNKALPIHKACNARYETIEEADEVIETLLEATNNTLAMWEQYPVQSLFHMATANPFIGMKTLQRIYDRQPENILKKKFLRGTPLHSAAQSGDVDRIRWLLSLNPDDIKALDAYGRTPLYVVAAEAVTIPFYFSYCEMDFNRHYKVLTFLYEQYPDAVAMKDARSTNLPVHETILSYLRIDAVVRARGMFRPGSPYSRLMKLYFSMIQLMLRKLPLAALETTTLGNSHETFVCFEGVDKLLFESTDIQFENLLPYDACVRFGLDPETHPLIREIMMAAPDNYAEQLRVFHYRERRGAMVLLFSKEVGCILCEASSLLASSADCISNGGSGDLNEPTETGISASQKPTLPDFRTESRIRKATQIETPWLESVRSQFVRLKDQYGPHQIKYKCDGPLIWHLLRSHGDQALIRYIITML